MPKESIDVNIEFRSLRESDYDDLAALLSEAQSAEGVPMRQVGEEIREDFESLPVDLGAHTLTAWVDGTLVGASYAYHVPSEERLECCYVFGAVRPAFRGRGVGSRLVRHGVATADRLLSSSTNSVPKHIRAVTAAGNEEAADLFAAEGMRVIRHFSVLRRSLDSLPLPRDTEGFRIVPWDASRSEEILAAKNSAFRDHWGSVPTSPEMWRVRTEGFGARPDLSFVAVGPDNGVVGFVLAHRYENDDPILGARYAWIDNVGTRAEWRGRGVASGLISNALAAFRRDGLGFAAIEVDSESPTGAHRLYESLGFAPWHRTVMWQRDVVGPDRGTEEDSR